MIDIQNPKLLYLVLVLALAPLTRPAPAQAEDPVWFWFKRCGGPTMHIQVRFDDKVIYEASFPICRAPRPSVAVQSAARSLHFFFTPDRAIVWKGYREDDDGSSDQDSTTHPGQRLGGDIWLAGSDPNALILGVAFRTEESIYMNTLHIAHPDRLDRSEIASGLSVATTPSLARGHRK